MDLSELIESVDLVDYISQYTDFEEKNGEFWCLSLFKDEKTPSFSVRRETNSFYDFSSGIGGNILTFIRYFDHCDNKTAIEKLKTYVGYKGEVAPHHKLAITRVAEQFSTPKKVKKKAETKPLPDDQMSRYEKRDEKLAVWRAEGISQVSLDRFQVRYDAFSNRLVYPIRNTEGKIVNVGGRTLDPDWKEKKLRKYTYFFGWGGGMGVIYGLSENREAIQKTKEIILFEGCKSVLLADTWGIQNCGAILTSHLSPAQMDILIGLECRVVFALDKDVVIREDHNIQKLKRYARVEYLWDAKNLLDEKDAPVDKGLAVFQALYKDRLVLR